MQNKIQFKIDELNRSLEWIAKYKPEDYEQKFLQLVEERRKLQKLQTAEEYNPAIAAYGVSQVGKSYLMNCMLQKNGEPFLIKTKEKSYKFIEEMNPKTSRTEATGVVTRFSSFSKMPITYNEQYPIIVKCLSITDIVLILSDGYYNDVHDYTPYSETDIETLGKQIYTKYSQKARLSTPIITSDSVLEMKAYFQKHINNAHTFLHTSFFNQLCIVAERIPAEDLMDVFSILWCKCECFSKLFDKMLNTLKKLQYKKFVYLPVQALLHDGINENTVMSVQCLNDLFLEKSKYYTDVYLSNSYEKVSMLTKSEICAVCAEIIVKIDDEYLTNTSQYNFCGIKDTSVQQELLSNRIKVERINNITKEVEIASEISIDLLKTNDLMDFPGARARKKELLDTLQEDTILINVLLRGKVAYLFNLYNESRMINTLLYCHHADQHDVNDLPLLLNDWIMNYVGDTMEKRQKTLECTGGISPFFYIGTKFNMDMENKPEQIENEINAINGRWQQRFEKVLYHQCFNADGSLDAQKIKVFLNWTKKGEYFNNAYILRDFKFSGEKVSKLYKDENTDRREMLISEEHYHNLRNTFCTNEHVRRFFSYPELSWDVCASINNDGAQYIIAQLNKIAPKMLDTRKEQFKSIISNSTQKITNLLEGYHISEDVDELLEGNIRKANAIFREMDFTCNSDNYYFGHLLQALQLKEATCYKIIHDLIQSPELIGKPNDFKDYEIIINSCKKAGYPIEGVVTDEEKLQCVVNTYGFSSHEEAEEFLTKKHIDIQKLFSESYKRKLNSYVIGDAVFEAWCAYIKSVEFLNEFSNEDGFDNAIMTMLVDNLILSAIALHLPDRMANAIAEYVNVVNIQTATKELLADILASIINGFVLDFGYQYLSDDTKCKTERLCKTRNIRAFNYICQELPAVCEEEALTKMFNEMSTSPKALLPSFEDNYNKWIEYMFISFLTNLDVPEYDHQANQLLSEIIENIKQAI